MGLQKTILKLGEMTPEQKDNYLEYFNNALLTGALGFKVMQPADEFDENGLKFPIEYLNQLGVNVVFLPIEMMAEYADIITKSSIDGYDKGYYEFLSGDDLESLDEMYESGQINATSIGNMAYIAMHCKDQTQRDLSDAGLNKIFSKHKKAVLNMLPKMNS